MSAETATFVPEGEVFPNLHADTELVHRLAELSDEALDYKAKEYSMFLERTYLMPRAINAANRILEHIIFEMNFRNGIYGK